MRKVTVFKLSCQDIQLVRLVGAFILVAALLMFVRAGAQMFDSWDAVKDAQKCFSEVGVNPAYESVSQCKEMAKGLGLYVKSNQIELTSRQFWSALLKPIADLFLWAVLFLFGLMLYRTGSVVIPLERFAQGTLKPRPTRKKK